MGPDSKERVVSGMISGKEELYRVTPVKGEPYIVNKSHILSLKRYLSPGEHEIVNISVEDYLRKGPVKIAMKGWRTGVDFPEKEVPIDPYFLGVWLGDGNSSNCGITSADKEIIEYYFELGEKYGLGVSKYGKDNSATYRLTMGKSKKGQQKEGRNYILKVLRDLNLLNNKHIPDIYRLNSREVRLQVLAGLIDTDGHKDSSNTIEYLTKSEKLADDMIYLCRSLGFAAYKRKRTPSYCPGCVRLRAKKDIVNGVCRICKGELVKKGYWVFCISGDLSEVPVKLPRKVCTPRKQPKNVLVTGIKVEPTGTGEYFGFELTGDGLFLLGDFTVTHNTTLISALFNHLLNKKVTCIFVTSDSFRRFSVDDVFSFINKYLAPAILVFEDIDLVGYDRKFGISSVIGPLLSSLSGIEAPRKPIVVVGTTNRIGSLDKAMTRPCRFDRKLHIDYPKEEELKELFEKFSGKPAPKKLLEQKKLTGAHVKEICNTAQLLALQNKGRFEDYVDQAIDTVVESFHVGAGDQIGFKPTYPGELDYGEEELQKNDETGDRENRQW